MKTKEPSEEFKAQVSDYVPKKRKRPWSLTPANISKPSVQDQPNVENQPDAINEPKVGNQPDVGKEPKVTFQPKVGNQPEVINEPKVGNQPDVENEPKVGNQPEVTNEPKVENQPDVENEPKVTFQPKVGNQPEVINEPKVGNQPDVGNEPKVTFQPKVGNQPDVINEPKVAKKFKMGLELEVHQHASMDTLYTHSAQLSVGFTRVPNEILNALMNGDLGKQATQVLIAIYRMTIGFNKDEAPLSIGVLSNLTSLQSSRISSALNELETKNLIFRKSGSINCPNILKVLYSEELSKFGVKPKVTNEPKVTFQPKVENQPYASGSKVTLRLRSESDLQYIQNRQIDTLSQNEIENYLNSLPPAKGKKEREALIALRDNYKNEEIEKSFNFLKVHGELKTGEICHSPLTYLSYAMNDVLKKINENEKKSRGTEDFLERQTAEEKLQAEQEKEDKEAFKLKEKAFLETFPTEYDQVLQVEKLIEGIPVKVGPEIARRVAITRWWETNQN